MVALHAVPVSIFTADKKNKGWWPHQKGLSKATDFIWLSSWWFQPTHLKNMLVKMGIVSPKIGVKIKHMWVIYHLALQLFVGGWFLQHQDSLWSQGKRSLTLNLDEFGCSNLSKQRSRTKHVPNEDISFYVGNSVISCCFPVWKGWVPFSLKVFFLHIGACKRIPFSGVWFAIGSLQTQPCKI